MQDSSENDSWYRQGPHRDQQQQGVRLQDLPTRSESIPSGTSSPGLLGDVEAFLAAFFGTTLACFIVTFAALSNRLALVLPAGQYMFGVLVATLLMEGPFLFRIWSVALGGQRPIGPAVAARFGYSNALLRFLFAIWWLMHVVAGIAIVVFLEADAMRGKIGFGALFHALFVFGASASCNVYIALFVKSLQGTDAAVTRFWRWRLLVDLGVTAIALALVYSQ